MMPKLIKFSKEARDSMIRGASILATAVKSTLGPRSKNVAIARNGLTPLVIHDGVTVARSTLPLKDPFENLGAELLKEAAHNTNELVGDGTTTATVIADHLIREGIKLTEGGISGGEIKRKFNSMEIKEKLNDYANVICGELDKLAKKIKKEDWIKIAKISAGDEEISKLVSESVSKVGASGLIMTGKSPTFESYIEHVSGMEFDNGYLSPYFVTDANRMIVEHKDALILLIDRAISDASDLVPILEKIHKEFGAKKAFVLIAHDVTGMALQGLVELKMKGTLSAVAIVAPEYAERRTEMLEDLAILTGATLLSPDKGDDIKNCEISELGRASVKVTATHTIITPLNPDKEELKLRADAIKEQIKNEDNSFRKDRLKYRLAKITQGVIIIRVGGASEAEVNDKKLRIEDAVNAVRAGIEEGMISGGGVALRDIAFSLRGQQEQIGSPILDLVCDALVSPFRTLLENSGIEKYGDLEWNEGEGVNVITENIENMFESGIIDPVKVTKLAIRHAFSVAGMFLTTDTLIVNEPDSDIQKIKVV